MKQSDVPKSYRKCLILKDNNITFPSSRHIVLLGENDCDKTTLLNVIRKIVNYNGNCI